MTTRMDGSAFLKIPLFKELPRTELFDLVNELPVETFQTGDSTASLNLDPQDCPTCRLGLSYYSN